jgi:formate hydrogenlyase subunit 3/multisubunit Na+/H+ antiporter MnhD subunit
LMAVPPFHLWIPSSAKDLNIYAVGFTAVLLQSAGLFLLLRFLDTYEWMRTNEALARLISGFGLISIWAGGLAALSKSQAKQVIAYALVVDFGIMLIAVGVGSPTSLRLALGMMGARIISLAVAALGLVSLESESGGTVDGGIARVAALVGSMSLAGLPLLAGFPGRWALLEAVSRVSVFLAASIVFGVLALAVSAIRAISPKWEPDSRSRATRGATADLFLIAGIALCVIFGLLPDLLYPWIADMVAAYSNLLP